MNQNYPGGSNLLPIVLALDALGKEGSDART